jgi:hypothetical protein
MSPRSPGCLVVGLTGTAVLLAIAGERRLPVSLLVPVQVLRQLVETQSERGSDERDLRRREPGGQGAAEPGGAYGRVDEGVQVLRRRERAAS